MSKMKKCKTCDNHISVKAKTCPKCGEEYKNYTMAEVASLAIVITLFLLYQCTNTTKPEKVDANNTKLNYKESKNLDDTKLGYEENCKNDYKKCKNNTDVMNMNYDIQSQSSVYCKSAAEEQSNTKIDWGNWLSFNFSFFEPGKSALKEDKIVVIDKVAMYENEYGGKIKKETRCVYNIKTKKVESIEWH